MNNVSIVGRLTKDPFIRQVGENRQVCTFTLAVNRNFKNSQGESEADFIQCNVWNKLAEQVVKYCGKGSLVGVSGRLQSHNYTNAEGKRIFITDVYADSVRFLQLKSANQMMKAIEDFQLPTEFTEQPMK